MRKIVVVVVAVLFLLTSLSAKKLYEVKSGMIKMVEKSEVNVGFGSKPTKSTSYSTIHFANYGDKLAVEIEDIDEQNGKTKTKMIVDGKMVYMVDFDEKSVMKMDMEKMPMATKMFDMDTLKKQFNLKKVGTDKIVGYKCDIYKSDKMELCLYKGVALKTTSKIFGTSSSVATSAKFNTSIHKSVFEVPNYPVETMDDIYGGLQGKIDSDDMDGENDKDSELNMENIQKAMGEMNKALENMSPEERKQLESLMKIFSEQN